MEGEAPAAGQAGASSLSAIWYFTRRLNYVLPKHMNSNSTLPQHKNSHRHTRHLLETTFVSASGVALLAALSILLLFVDLRLTWGNRRALLFFLFALGSALATRRRHRHQMRDATGRWALCYPRYCYYCCCWRNMRAGYRRHSVMLGAQRTGMAHEGTSVVAGQGQNS